MTTALPSSQHAASVGLVTGRRDALAEGLARTSGLLVPGGSSAYEVARAALDEQPRLDAWVHLVPDAPEGPADEVAATAWAEAVDAALTDTLRAAQVVGRAMLAQTAGTIVLVLAEETDSPVAAILNGGIVGLAKVLAVEWAERGIRVVTVPRAGDLGHTLETVRFALSGAAAYVTGALLEHRPAAMSGEAA